MAENRLGYLRNRLIKDPTKLNAELELNNDELLKCHKVLHTKCKVLPAGEVSLKPLLNHFSTLSQLERAAAWLAKLPTIRRVKMRREHDSWQLGPCLSAADLKSATSDIVKLVHKDYFSCELATLNNQDKFINQAQFSGRIKNSGIRNLSPILVKGILRVGGRLECSTIHAERKTSRYLPRNFARSLFERSRWTSPYPCCRQATLLGYKRASRCSQGYWAMW